MPIFGRCPATAPFKSPDGVIKIARYLRRRRLLYGNPAPRKVLKKIFSTAAVVTDDDRTESLVSQELSELANESAVIVRHGNSPWLD